MNQMNSWQDIFQQLKSTVNLNDIIKETQLFTKNDIYRQEYEKMISTILEKSISNIDYIQYEFIFRLLSLVEVVFPQNQKYRESVQFQISILSQINVNQKNSQIVKQAQHIMNKYQLKDKEELFSLSVLFSVQLKISITGLDIMRTNSLLILQSQRLQFTYKSGVLFGLYLSNQNKNILQAKFTQIFIRKVLIKCIETNNFQFLNGFQQILFIEIIKLLQIKKNQLSQYIQLIYDEYLNILDQFQDSILSDKITQCLMEIFQLSRQQILSQQIQFICLVEYKSILQFIVKHKRNILLYQISVIMSLIEDQLKNNIELIIQLLFLFPHPLVSQILAQILIDGCAINLQLRQHLTNIKFLKFAHLLLKDTGILYLILKQHNFYNFDLLDEFLAFLGLKNSNQDYISLIDIITQYQLKYEQTQQESYLMSLIQLYELNDQVYQINDQHGYKIIEYVYSHLDYINLNNIFNQYIDDISPQMYIYFYYALIVSKISYIEASQISKSEIQAYGLYQNQKYFVRQ